MSRRDKDLRNATAQATTGPAKGPLPTSSTPTTDRYPFFQRARSSLNVGGFIAVMVAWSWPFPRVLDKYNIVCYTSIINGDSQPRSTLGGVSQMFYVADRTGCLHFGRTEQEALNKAIAASEGYGSLAR